MRTAFTPREQPRPVPCLADRRPPRLPPCLHLTRGTRHAAAYELSLPPGAWITPPICYSCRYCFTTVLLPQQYRSRPFLRSRLAMGGGHDGESLPRCRCFDDVTLVLVGKVGSGKSATGNSILGWDAFQSKHSCTSVTETCQVHRRTFSDGSSEARTISVIDTPGLFDMNTKVGDAQKEIAKCMDLSKDGIHAMLMVFSATHRFSHEDVNTVESIRMFFGDTIADHMILVFTNGDQVDENTLNEMLSDKRAIYLQNLVKLCANRVVLFDNKTKDEVHKKEQLKKLLRAVDYVISHTDGIPFSNQMFSQIKEVHERQKETDGYTAEETFKSKKDIYDGYLMLITKMVEDKLNITIEKMQNQLMEEQKARHKVEKEVAEAKLRAEEEIRELRENLEKAQQDRLMEEHKARQNLEKEVAEAKLRAEEEIRELRESLEKVQKDNDSRGCTIL